MKAEAGDTEGEEEMEDESVPALPECGAVSPSHGLSPECSVKEEGPVSPLCPSSLADCDP